MKKCILLFLLSVLAMLHSSFAQDLFEIKSEQKAIAILRSNDFMQIYKSENCDLAKIERFIGEIDKVIPLEAQNRGKLEKQLLAMVNSDIIIWTLSGPRISMEADNALKNSLTDSEYNELSDEFAKKMKAMQSAYQYLSSLHQHRVGIVPFGYPGTPEYIDNVYDYFGI